MNEDEIHITIITSYKVDHVVSSLEFCETDFGDYYFYFYYYD